MGAFFRLAQDRCVHTDFSASMRHVPFRPDEKDVVTSGEQETLTFVDAPLEDVPDRPDETDVITSETRRNECRQPWGCTA